MIPSDNELPKIGAPVNLRWRDRWITARVVRQRTGGLLDLVADGVPRECLLSVGRGSGGWLPIDEVPLDWKQRHANDAETAIEHPMVESCARELAANLGVGRGGLEWFGILKLATYAAQVARAQALGFDADLLSASADEANAELTRRAAELVLSGVPVRVIGL